MLEAIREKFTGWIAILIIGLISLTLVISFGNMDQTPLENDVVITVNSKEISLFDYREEFSNQLQRYQEVFGDQIPKILELAENLGAVAHHIFLLVPTGRGKYIVDSEINAREYEETLNWFYDQSQKTSLQLKATCAPHYYRILRQRAKEEGQKVTFESHGLDAVTRGCLAGTGFCFISHVGRVQTCGFLDVECGDITKQTFKDVWENSQVFNSMRDFNNLEGKCGICEFKRVCGGCRARAYEATGSYLSQEPLCSYKPKKTQ